MKTITIAHSKDADDIFMYYAIKFGWVSHSNYVFDNIMSDIQTLNNGAKNNIYDVCAISFANFPNIKDDYSLLNTAISFGYGYGPKLIAKKTKTLKKNFTVALSGEDTTNALIFKIKYPYAKIIYMDFLQIQQAVLDDVVDAGVLIHEDILTFDKSLRVECEIYDIWVDLAKEDIALPLGGMALKKSITLVDAILYQELLTKAVKIANDNKEFLVHMLYERNLLRVKKEDLNTYLNMYASDKSVSLDEQQIYSINKLFKLGYENKMYSEYIDDVRDYFIPSEYKEFRYDG